MNKRDRDDWMGIAVMLGVLFGIGSCHAKFFGDAKREWWQGGAGTVFSFGILIIIIWVAFFLGRLIGQRSNTALGIAAGIFILLLLAALARYLPQPWQ